ncbi:MAG: hypothetical protein ACP5IL_09505 [Syntrophobacteraceae bacterium]
MQTLPLARETENFVKNATKSPPAGAQAAKAKPPEARRPNAYESTIGSAEFKTWFGDSAVVFKEGESDYFQNPEGVCGMPRAVYHGVNTESGLDIFCSDEHGAIWFRSDRSMTERLSGKNSAVIPAFLRIENGVELEPDNFSTIGEAIAEAKARGSDGLFWQNKAGDYTYAVFSPEQVKSPLTDQFFYRGEIEPKGEKTQNCREPQKGFASKHAHGVAPSGSEAADGAPEKQVLPTGARPFRAIGKKIKDLTDLASFAARLTESDNKDLLYVFLDRETIIDHERGAPIHSEPLRGRGGKYLSREIERLKARVKRLGATSFYLVGNRSRENPKTSAVEAMTSWALAASIPQYRGRITINSNKYKHLDSSAVDPAAEKLSPSSGDWTCCMRREGLEERADTVKKIATWANALTQNRFAPLLIYIDLKKEVCGLQQIHPHEFMDICFTRKQMKKKLPGFGSIGAIALLPQKPSQNMLDAARYYAQAHIINCAIGFYGKSAYFLGQIQSDSKEN